MAVVKKASILPPDFFERDPLLCARELIGMQLSCGGCSGRIIETEAYHEVGDPACHLFTRPSAREFVRRHPAGTAYVYLNYGVHWLVNVLTCDPAGGTSGFVLFRALEAVTGIPLMEERRATTDPPRLCSGPTPFSPPSGPAQRLVQGPPAESKFLATNQPTNATIFDLYTHHFPESPVHWKF